jgi:hypothetical protein
MTEQEPQAARAALVKRPLQPPIWAERPEFYVTKELDRPLAEGESLTEGEKEMDAHLRDYADRVIDRAEQEFPTRNMPAPKARPPEQKKK